METIKYFIRQRSKLCVGKRKIRKRARKNYAYAQYVKKKERKTHTVDRLKSQYQMKQYNAKKPQLGKIGNDVLV